MSTGEDNPHVTSDYKRMPTRDFFLSPLGLKEGMGDEGKSDLPNPCAKVSYTGLPATSACRDMIRVN